MQFEFWTPKKDLIGVTVPKWRINVCKVRGSIII